MDISIPTSCLEARAISKRYLRHERFSRRKVWLDALRSVDISLSAGSIFALIGESGSGKSTLARCLAGLERPDAGEIRFADSQITALSERELRSIRPRIQLVFQDSATSLNPRYPIEWLIEEPLKIQHRGNDSDRNTRVRELMEEVGLPPSSSMGRGPLQFSGGQRQRIALARALALEPEVLILDESLSALDLSTQAEMVKLLLTLRQRHRFACLFISHDLRLVSQIADQVAVMYRGEIVERGSCSNILARPQHQHTVALVRAVRELQSACAAVVTR